MSEETRVYTDHYELVEPGYDENADIKDINDNMEKIDAALHRIEVQLGIADPDSGETVTPKVIKIANGGTNATTAANARTNLGLGSVATENKVPLSKGGTNATDAAGARTNLGLGNLATINAPLPVDKGGTNATTAANARTNLGLGGAATISTPISITNGGTGKTTAPEARANLGLGDLATVNSPLPVNKGGTGSTSASAARTALGLGAAAVLASPIPIANGGTGMTGTSNTNNTYNGISISMYKWGRVVFVVIGGVPTSNISQDGIITYQGAVSWSPVTTVSFPLLINGGQSVARCSTSDGKTYSLMDAGFSSKPNAIHGTLVYLTNA